MATGDLRRLRRHPGYPLFYATATITRLADDMFSVGVVLLVLDRTGSAALAGRDRRGGDAAEPRDRAAAGRVARPQRPAAPGDDARPGAGGVERDRHRGCWPATRPTTLVPLVALVAGITWPLSFGGFTSLIPVIVPDRAAAAGQRARGDELQHRHHRRTGSGGNDRGHRGAGRRADRRGGADHRGARADRPDPGDGRARAHRRPGPPAARDRAGRAARDGRDARAALGDGGRSDQPERHRAADHRVSLLRHARAGRGPQRVRLHVGRVRGGLDGRGAGTRAPADALSSRERHARRARGAGLPDADLAAGGVVAGGARADRAGRDGGRSRPGRHVRRAPALDAARAAGPDLHHGRVAEGRRVRDRSGLRRACSEHVSARAARCCWRPACSSPR